MNEAETAESLLGQSWLRLALDAAPSAMLLVDAGRKIVLVTQGSERLLGYRRVELVGRELELLIPDVFRRQGGDLSAGLADGSELAVQVQLNSIEAPGGPFTLASIVARPTQGQREDELRRCREDLQQFAYVASHDLQEPLRMVSSYTELLAQRYQGKLDERADKYICYAVDGAKRMQRMLADLLAYSRVSSQAKPLAPVSAEAVVKGVVAALGAAIGRANASIKVGPLPIVRADEAQLGQLFQSLIGNALKFQGEAPPLVEIGATPLEDRWQFAIKDNGIGIDSQHTERIFQMFQRLHERGKYEGSGVGLAIAKRIAERHGGRIWLESEPRLGSTFFFTLQAAALQGQP
jgi:light-regulated signal transduction histidine kinase (bacteriophytochrome)